MMLVDTNILLYAEDKSSSFHQQAISWWDSTLSGDEPVCLCWPVILAFMRLTTNKRIFEFPLSIDEASTRVQSWLDQPCVRLIGPTSRHWILLQEMLKVGQATANLVMDAHLAALAVEHGSLLYSTDKDFSRFPKLKWKNPLE